ncbi:MAG: RNA polymerase sigma factor [Planctomycetota bacterium]
MSNTATQQSPTIGRGLMESLTGSVIGRTEVEIVAESDSSPASLASEFDVMSRSGQQPSEAATIASVGQSVLERIAAGEASAVDQCLDQFGNLVWSLARRYCVSPTDAEDVTQEIFLQLWQQAERYDSSVASEATFVATIARRRLIDHQRRVSRQRTVSAVEEPALEANEQTPDLRIELSDEAAKATRCMENLSAAQRDVLILSVSDGESHQVISDRLSMPLGTVKSHARRALLQLRRCMGLDASAVAAGGAS